MAELLLPRPKIPTKSPQPGRAKAARTAAGRAAGGRVFASGTGRPATRGDGRPVVELDAGITVYPAREEGDRWRAVWYENGQRRQCEARTEDRLAARLEKVTERLTADAPNMERPGADLIAYYLSPDRHPVTCHLIGTRPASRGRASTRTPSAGCANGSWPRSSARSRPAKTSRSPTCSRSSTPRRRQARATGCTGACRPWSRRGSPAGIWPARGWGRCTGRSATGLRSARRFACRGVRAVRRPR